MGNEQTRLSYRLSELARLTGLSLPFLRKEVRAGRLKTRKVSGAVIVKAQDAEAFLNGTQPNHKGGQERQTEFKNSKADSTQDANLSVLPA